MNEIAMPSLFYHRQITAATQSDTKLRCHGLDGGQAPAPEHGIGKAVEVAAPTPIAAVRHFPHHRRRVVERLVVARDAELGIEVRQVDAAVIAVGRSRWPDALSRARDHVNEFSR